MKNRANQSKCSKGLLLLTESATINTGETSQLVEIEITEALNNTYDLVLLYFPLNCKSFCKFSKCIKAKCFRSPGVISVSYKLGESQELIKVSIVVTNIRCGWVSDLTSVFSLAPLGHLTNNSQKIYCTSRKIHGVSLKIGLLFPDPIINDNIMK